MRKNLFLSSSFIFIFLLNFLGCVPVPYVKTAPHEGLPGIYHRVKRSETLWKISKMYDVDLGELARVNRILDSTTIEVGQLLFIPNRQTVKPATLRYSSEDFIWPIKGRVIATFGETYNNMINKGINIQPHSGTEVVASRSGRVVFYANGFGGYGKTIIIEHGDGLSTVYARNSEVFIKAGESVQKGAVIAKAGSAGRDKNTYLHFEIRKGHIPQTPYYYLPR